MAIGYPIHVTADDDFKFEWPEPELAQQSWLWDQMHCPRPVCPVGGDLFGGLMAAVMGGRHAIVNGYPYRAFTGPPPSAAQLPPPTSSKPLIRVWEEDHLPLIREICDRIRLEDYDSMPLPKLGALIEGIVEDGIRAFSYTFGAAVGFFGPTNALVDFCEQELGPTGALQAMTMLQGYENESAGAGAGLARLAELAASLPEVAAALRDGRLSEVEAVSGGPEFMRELRSYLDAYGWRAETWAEIHKPTWAEDPRIPLGLVRRYLADQSRSPRAAHERAAEQREEAIAAMESRLDGEKLARYRTLLAAAAAHVPVSEGRALWQLITVGVLRIPLLAIGRKLAEQGHLDSVEDVFFLRLPEIVEVASGDVKFAPKQVSAMRRQDHERWGHLIPPRYLGVAPPAAMVSLMSRFFGGIASTSTEASVINGMAASAGVARGTARVILDLSDAERLNTGDILVCPSTAPPWTPLFAVAGAVVADSGGVLSHTAICAREYAIPAVVSTIVATRQIPDGATVTVDGTKGIVRIEALE